MQMNKKRWMYCGLGAIIIVICAIVLHFTSVCHMRSVLRDQCGLGMDCACFANVVEYRMTDNEVRSFYRYIKEMRKRPSNLLEFANEIETRNISNLVALCRPQVQVQQPVQQAQPAQKKK